jgi:zinc protease
MKINTVSHQSVQHHIVKTEHKDFVTGSCLLPMGWAYANYESRHIPTLLSSMLVLGSQSKNEDEWNALLESKGIQLSVSDYPYFMIVKFTCLTKCLEETIGLIGELLKFPRFDPVAFEKLQKRMVTNYQTLMDDTEYLSQVAFTQAIYPEKHMNRYDSPKTMIELIEHSTLEQIKQFHQSHLNFSQAQWVFVGDVPTDIYKTCVEVMPMEGQESTIQRSEIPSKMVTKNEVVSIADKQSVDLVMGHMVDIDHKHPDYIPLLIAIDALGGSFSARLMRTVRDEDGLTYRVGSSLTMGIGKNQCFWTASGSFAPSLLETGEKSIMKQLEKWVNEGISEEELLERKTGIVGKYKVRLSDARAVAGRIASDIEQGFPADYLYQYPKEVNAVNLDDVNRVIKTYIKLDLMSKISCGSL